MVAKKRIKNPNLQMWQQYDDQAEQRGELVVHVVQKFISFADAIVLDFGCGTGGISCASAKHGAHVFALDVDENRLAVLAQRSAEKSYNITIVRQTQHLAAAQFHAILLVDVLEHVENPQQLLMDCYRWLKPGGVLYLTTPNKYSPLNVFCDPHFSLPFVGLLKRLHVRRVVGNWLRWQPIERLDYPQLISYNQLRNWLHSAGFIWQFVNRQAAQFAVHHPPSLWNRPWHLKIVQSNLGQILLNFIARHFPNKKNFLQQLNPTWFVVARK